MAKIKYTIEIDEKAVEDLKKQFQTIVDKTGITQSPKSFESFLEQIIEGYVKTGEQLKDLGTKFSDLFGKMGDFGDMDLDKIFGNFTSKKNKDEKKEDDPKTTNLKN
jgi:hypothetical protein